MHIHRNRYISLAITWSVEREAVGQGQQHCRTQDRRGKALRKQLSLEVFPNEALCDPPVCVTSSHRAIIHVDFESIEFTQYGISLDETCFASQSEPLTLYLISIASEIQGKTSNRDMK